MREKSARIIAFDMVSGNTYIGVVKNDEEHYNYTTVQLQKIENVIIVPTLLTTERVIPVTEVYKSTYTGYTSEKDKQHTILKDVDIFLNNVVASHQL